MKSAILLFSMLLLLVLPAFAQDMQYVRSKSGDTLVVKDDIAFGSTNTLYNLMAFRQFSSCNPCIFSANGGIYSCVNNPYLPPNIRPLLWGRRKHL